MFQIPEGLWPLLFTTIKGQSVLIMKQNMLYNHITTAYIQYTIYIYHCLVEVRIQLFIVVINLFLLLSLYIFM